MDDILSLLQPILPFFFFLLFVIFGNLTDKKKPKVKKEKKLQQPKRTPLPDIAPPAGGRTTINIDIRPRTEVQADNTDSTSESMQTKETPHRPHRPMEYESVHNPYQRYLETRPEPVIAKQDTQPAAVQAVLTSQQSLNLKQAIIISEILGRPKALKKR